jgi:hypothetical protein
MTDPQSQNTSEQFSKVIEKWRTTAITRARLASVNQIWRNRAGHRRPGVGRKVTGSTSTSPFVNNTFYLGKLSIRSTNWVVGYIRDYNPQLQYRVRSADDGILSQEKIPVQRGSGSP